MLYIKDHLLGPSLGVNPVGLKPLHRTQYVVLHHRQRETGNLCGEM